MEVREALESDIPEIVALLKQSLGESLMPKSEAYWRWKHIDNPFGKSPVLVSTDENKLVGVRAFMRWQWKHKDRSYLAVRAVDTATHPEYQGKGIFKKLTLSLVDRCTKLGDHFVYNTPNEQSKPGYLKMGWEIAGRLPINVNVRRPLSILNQFVGKAKTDKMPAGNVDKYLDHDGLESLLIEHLKQTLQISTAVTSAYLRWRYHTVPVVRYMAIGHGDITLNALVIGRIKQGRFGKEFRITDLFFRDDNYIKRIKGDLMDNLKQWNIDYVTIAATAKPFKENIVRGLGFNVNRGPIVTVRRLAMEDLNLLKNFNQWIPTLGDLELF